MEFCFHGYLDIIRLFEKNMSKYQVVLNHLYTEFIKMADAQKRSGVSYRQHGVEAF